MRGRVAERRVVKAVEKIAYGENEEWPEGMPKVSERMKALEWLARQFQMEPAEKHRQEMETRKMELAERKQQAEERQEEAHRRTEGARQQEDLCRLQVEVVGAPSHPKAKEKQR